MLPFTEKGPFHFKNSYCILFSITTFLKNQMDFESFGSWENVVGEFLAQRISKFNTKGVAYFSIHSFL